MQDFVDPSPFETAFGLLRVRGNAGFELPAIVLPPEAAA